jgi:hypothetical protein
MTELNIEDLGLNFTDFSQGLEQDTNFQFGPTKNQLKSFKGWEGFEGKLFKPYNIKEKVSKISDFVGAAIMLAKENERMLEKNEFQKKKDQDNAEKKAQEMKKYKAAQPDDDDDEEEEDTK